MIIEIQGHTINTDNISYVTRVTSSRRMFGHYTFTIHIGDTGLVIWKSVNDKDVTEKYPITSNPSKLTPEDEEKREYVKALVEEMRDCLIHMWNNNKPPYKIKG